MTAKSRTARPRSTGNAVPASARHACPDWLDNPDPRRAAEHAHLEALLRCWLAETRTAVIPGPLYLELAATRVALVAEVVYASPTGRHRFGPVRLERTDGSIVADPADPVLAAGLVAAEAASRGGRVLPGQAADLIERTAESVRNTTTFIAARRAHPDGDSDGFLAAEQALLLGHLHHPAPKSRGGLSAHDLAEWSPETRGAFTLEWFTVDPSVVSHDDTDAAGSTPDLMARLAETAPPPDRILVPAHPWQARDLRRRPRIAALIASGALTPLGPLGPAWSATSSVRTLYREDAPVMLKLSLGLWLTNSRREATRTELRRGVEIDRLLRSGYADATFNAHPGFAIIRDPAWLAVDEPGAPGGPEVTGLDVSVRAIPENCTGLRCLAGLLAPQPGLGSSALARLVDGPDAATAWVAHYVDRVLVPMLHLYGATGIGLEGHQQNTLVRLDGEGLPCAGAFRDNQGYYLGASWHDRVREQLGVESSTLAVVDDAVVEDRLSYYLLRNQILAVVGCLGAEGRADERVLLGVITEQLAAALPTLKEAGPGAERLVRRWLDSDSLPLKANLLTRLHGIDEVRAPLDAQSVYIEGGNPLRAAYREGHSR